MIKKILLSLSLLLLTFVVVGLFLPKSYNIKRGIKIYASPVLIHPYISDLQQWPVWAPWQSEDPTIKTVIGEVASGKGASQSWTGSAGEGHLLITKSDITQGISYEFTFSDDSEMSYCDITYKKKKDSTYVRWVMYGKYTGFLAGYRALLTDAMFGEIFSNGLKNLKSVIESKLMVEEP